MEVKDKSVRSVSWLFYTIVLPLIFFVVFMALVLQFVFGFNVTQRVSSWFTQMPIVRHVIGLPPTPVAVPLQVAALKHEMSTVTAQATILTHKLLLAQSQLATADQQLAAAQRQARSAERKLHEVLHTVASAKQSASIYTNLPPYQAALILEKQSFLVQVAVLQAMDPADQATIISKMPVGAAAKLLQAGV